MTRTQREMKKMNRTLAVSLSCAAACASLTGCAGTACSYLTAVHNQAPVTYRVRETGAIIPPNGKLDAIRYRQPGGENVATYHLDPVKYHQGSRVFGLATETDRRNAYAAWSAEIEKDQQTFSSPEAWIMEWLGGAVTLQHNHSFNPWGGPSWTELITNTNSNATAETWAGRFHVEVGVGQDRQPWIRSRAGLCP